MDAKPLALIIEDNEDQNLVFTTALKQAGFITESFHEGVTAMNRLGKVIPDLVVLDLHVPGINGGLLLRGIRNDMLTAKTHVIIVSADAEFAARLEAQADIVLIKPVSFSQLVKVASSFNIPKSSS
jgi:CheY-like chemotaxis protein